MAQDRDERHEHRHLIEVEGRYRYGTGVARDVRILDISESGCRFYDRFGTLEAGSEITIRIGPIGPIVATVRWCVNHVVGVQFASQLYGPVFEHIRATLDERNRTQARTLKDL
ncbi:MAG: PilZ domain-containing protein [Sphingomonadales bacterium]|nr:PilZ domain-containing protein [Sphingomonadales bacterium]MBD3774843.1 PilZ domain-containing protein [Paracoccaceae bacterium]MBD3813904.1 PilZ domain-containing protein [Betaproteobacteria bacterium]